MVRNLEHLLASEGTNSHDVVLASIGFPCFEASTRPQHIMGPSQPLEASSKAQGSQLITHEASNVKRSLTVAVVGSLIKG